MFALLRGIGEAGLLLPKFRTLGFKILADGDGNMVTLTEAAVSTLEQVIARAGGAAKGLRLAVSDGGCAGYKYEMGLEAEAAENDTVLSFGDVCVFIDANSGPLLSGMVVDYVEGIEGAGFKFENPNATSSCGCGKSFSAGEGEGASSCSTAPGASSGGCGTAH